MAVQHERVTVGTAATAFNPAQSYGVVAGMSIVVRNRGTAPVFVGGSNVTTATGYELGVGESLALDLADKEVVFGIAAAAQRVDVIRSGPAPGWQA